MAIPDRPSVDGLAERWSQRWEQSGTYRFDRSRPRAEVYAIDTPPPTVSGSLHVGHVFSYTHTDIIARFWRMRGRSVFYPMGWDDNGLPTERRVQNYYGVRCDPTMPYDPDFQPPANPTTPVAVSRRTFVELCERLTTEDEQAFEQLWRTLGLSIDWSLCYQTIDSRARAVSQRAFLADVAAGRAYQAEAPTLWDVTFQTAVAQAELEDRERPGAYHRVAFTVADPAAAGATVVIETSRPELIAACVGLVAHPDDERYTGLIGGTVHSPVFNVAVPVHAHPLADPEKGTGIAMVCTFGDLTDVTWWRELDLPTRAVIERDGRLSATTPSWLAEPTAAARYAELAGQSVHTARERMVAMLRTDGALLGEPAPITHAVKFFEKGDRPLEVVTSRQWYIRNGGRDRQLRDDLLARGRALTWHPAHMQVRYDTWVGGLTGDWLISRQRYFGVPIPLWYGIAADGTVDYQRVLLPDDADLPVDPQSEAPPGYDPSQRGQPGGFIGDPDVMDTWATSSLTPQIAGGWSVDDDLFARVFPMDLRPQSHEIIRTWLFATVVRASAQFGTIPWSDVAISGWILDPDRKKMSKSKGNVVTPLELLTEHGPDGVRYWAAMGRPGTDTAFDPAQMRVGRRLAIKILNATRFALSLGAPADGEVTEHLDRALLAGLASVVDEATAALLGYDYTRALEIVEAFFWRFTDDYVELVKDRAYGSRGPTAQASAGRTLTEALSVLTRLFAPFLPFVTEEVWSWTTAAGGASPAAALASVHHAPWPQAAPLRELAGDADVRTLPLVGEVLGAVRRAKTDARLSMRAAVDEVRVAAPADLVTLLQACAPDLQAAGSIADLQVVAAPDATSASGLASGLAIAVALAGA